jgi:membrane protein
MKVAEGPDTQHASPWKLGGLSLKELGWRVFNEMNSDEVPDRAAALSYYFLFALFPSLLFFVALVGMLPIHGLIRGLMTYTESVLPADAASIIRKTLQEVLRGAHSGLLSVGGVMALWAASSGMASLMAALSVGYDVEDPRPWWQRRLLAIGLTIVFSLLMLSAMVLLVFGGTIGGALSRLLGLGDLGMTAWNILQWPVAVFFVLFSLALLYYLAPAVQQRWYWVTPGSLVALVGWVAMSAGLRYYVGHFANYNATYGSIGGVILLMLWLYLTGIVLLLGAEINSEIENAAAERGAVTAKVRGERRPGDAGTAAVDERAADTRPEARRGQAR